MKSLERPAIHIALIALLGLVVYSNTFDVPFQWDKTYLLHNPIIRDLNYFFNPSDAKVLERYDDFKGRYISYLTFALNYKMHGFDVTGYHVVNLAVHLANALLVYWLAMLTFRTPFLDESTLGRRSGYIALLSALLFVSHPVQTEAVTYIYQRHTSLAAMFYIGSLVMYIKWRLSPSPFYLLSLLFAVLAMKTKENAFTLPVAIALYELVFFEGRMKKRLFRLLPFFLAMLIVPFTIVDFDEPLDSALSAATRTQTEVSRQQYFLTQFPVIVAYLRLLILPINQNLDYDYPLLYSFLEPRVFLSFVLLASLITASLFLFSRFRRKEPLVRVLAFGVLWFFVTLSVESSVIALADVIFEHRVYLPSAGLLLSFASCAFWAAGRAGGRLRPSFVLFAALIVIALSGAAYIRNGVWENEISLWEDVTRKSPYKARGHFNLALEYASKDRRDKALEHYITAIRLKPDYADARVNLGLTYLGMGLIDEARTEFETALKINPYDPKARRFMDYIAKPNPKN